MPFANICPSIKVRTRIWASTDEHNWDTVQPIEKEKKKKVSRKLYEYETINCIFCLPKKFSAWWLMTIAGTEFPKSSLSRSSHTNSCFSGDMISENVDKKNSMPTTEVRRAADCLSYHFLCTLGKYWRVRHRHSQSIWQDNTERNYRIDYSSHELMLTTQNRMNMLPKKNNNWK